MKPAFQKLLNYQPDDGVFIVVQRGQVGAGANASEIHDGHAQSANSPGHGGAFDARDNAMAVPSVEPSWQGALQLAFVGIDLPMTALVDIFGHAQQQAAAIRSGGFDQHSHPQWSFPASGGCPAFRAEAKVRAFHGLNLLTSQNGSFASEYSIRILLMQSICGDTVAS